MRWEVVLVAALVLFAVFYVSSFSGLLVQVPTTHAMRVIDGDTIEISGGEKVRLIGIDTPEKGQHFYGEAKERLAELIGGKEIVLEKDTTDRDKYGRLLRYIYVNGSELVNLRMVEEGLASVLIYPPDSEFEEDLRKAESLAREAGLGIWEYAGNPDIFCIGIYYFKFNAHGDDRRNLNDEYIEFRNKCTYPVNMEGWSVKDKAGHSYTFPDYTAPNKTLFRLRTGEGEDHNNDLYWGSSKAIWNNAGDGMEMRDENGRLILNYTYDGY